MPLKLFNAKLAISLLLIVSTASIAFWRYTYLQWQDSLVLRLHSNLKDIYLLEEGKMDEIKRRKYRLLLHDVKMFQDFLSSHPGQNYFVTEIQAFVRTNETLILSNSYLSEAEVAGVLSIQLKGITKFPYHFDSPK